MVLQPTSSQQTSLQPTFDRKLDMSTAHLLRQVATDVWEHARTTKVSISPGSTWTSALAVALKSLEDKDQAILIFPERSEERQEAIKKYVLSEKFRSSSNIPPTPSDSIGRRIRTPFPKDITPPPARPGTKERIREMAREVLAMGYRQPYTLDARATLSEGILATVSGTLTLGMIDAAEDSDTSVRCRLVVEDMLWDTGSHGCIITADLLPERLTTRLANPKDDLYCDGSGSIVQVQGYLALSNSQFFFESIFKVVPPSMVPNGRSGVILGQKCFMDHMDFRQVPRAILEGRGQELKEDEWGDIKIIEWMDPIGGETKVFPYIESINTAQN
jgi:hypothetical protein